MEGSTNLANADVEDLEYYETHRDFEEFYDQIQKWNTNRIAKLEQQREAKQQKEDSEGSDQE